jgi:hypothetical protein
MLRATVGLALPVSMKHSYPGIGIFTLHSAKQHQNDLMSSIKAVVTSGGVLDPTLRCLRRKGSSVLVYFTRMNAGLQSASVKGSLVDLLMTLPARGSWRNSKSPFMSMMLGSSYRFSGFVSRFRSGTRIILCDGSIDEKRIVV